MPANAFIPMGYDGGASIQMPNLQNMAAGANALQQMRARQQAAVAQNALAQIFSDPNSLQPDGSVKPEALRKVMQISPQAGMQVIQTQAKMQNTKAEAALHQADATQKKQALIHDDVLSPSIVAYDSALKAGMPPQQAAAAAQKVYSEGLDGVRKSGLFSEDEIANMPGNFDPVRVRSRAISYKDFMSQQTKDDADKRADAREARSERHMDVMEGLAEARLARSEAAGGEGKPKWEVLTDPKTGTQYRYDPMSAKATTLDGKPYSPQGAEKVGTEKLPGAASMPRSAAVMELRKFVEENPNATAADMQHFMARGGALSKAARDWSTGPQGNTVRSLNVAISHSDTLAGLVDALGNGDVKALNNLSQRWKEQTGNPAPTNFDEAKNIVGDEIVKAVLGSGVGAVTDRQAIQDSFNRASSPAQLAGVIKTAEQLMGGQLEGLRDQYKRTTGADDFDDSFLSSRTKAVIGKATPAATGKKPGEMTDEELKASLGLK